MCALDDVLLLRQVDATFDNDHSVLNEFFFHMVTVNYYSKV
jgi:hypothetical protein